MLASLQSVNSAKDVEQLLGRVLRMPYARNRTQEALNRAYAHIVADNFAQAAATLKDRMVQNMGFEKLETASLIIPSREVTTTGAASLLPLFLSVWFRDMALASRHLQSLAEEIRNRRLL